MARGFNPHEASLYRPPGTQWLDRMRRLHHPRMGELYGQLKDSANDDQSNLLQMIEQFLHTGQFSDGKNAGRFDTKAPKTNPDPGTDGDGDGATQAPSDQPTNIDNPPQYTAQDIFNSLQRGNADWLRPTPTNAVMGDTPLGDGLEEA